MVMMILMKPLLALSCQHLPAQLLQERPLLLQPLLLLLQQHCLFLHGC
jgi:hypothetical protein